LLNQQPRPVPEVCEQLDELGVQSVRRCDLLLRLLDVLHHIDDFVEHVVQRRDRIVR
jgi:hypothetical protein